MEFKTCKFTAFLFDNINRCGIMVSKKAVIIGGGPAGLTAAYELLRDSDIVPIVLEQSDYWGGISKTVNYKGNRIDIGGHRFFSKSEVVMDWWREVLPVASEQDSFTISYQNKKQIINNSQYKAGIDDKDVMLVRTRKSRIYFDKKFFEYPITLTPDTVRKLGLVNTILIGFSYLKSVLFPIKKESNLEEFFINRFGQKLYKKFFKDYTEKVWGIKCSEISAEWGAQRIKGLSITKTIVHFLKKSFSKKKGDILQKDTETSLIEYFLYPKYGPGQMWEKVASIIGEKGGELCQHIKVTAINVSGNKVTSITGINQVTGAITEYEGAYFISTMPIKDLIAALQTNVPQDIRQISDGLLYRDFITVGLLLKKMKVTNIEDNWIYIQEPDVKIGRLQIFNNWSPFLVKDKDTVWIGLEYFCNEGDELWTLSEDEMISLGIKELASIGLIDPEDVLDGMVLKVPKTYPAYFGTYDRFDELRAYLDGFENLFLAGRNGMHKYNNQDHSMLTAIEAVNNIKRGLNIKSNIWAVNTEQEYHEEK